MEELVRISAGRSCTCGAHEHAQVMFVALVPFQHKNLRLAWQVAQLEQHNQPYRLYVYFRSFSSTCTVPSSDTEVARPLTHPSSRLMFSAAAHIPWEDNAQKSSNQATITMILQGDDSKK